MSHPQVPLGDVADFINGAAFKPEDWGEDGLPIIRIQNLTDSSKPFNYTRRKVSEKLVVNPGDLLVSWSATLGVFQWNGPQGLLNQHIFRVLPDDALVDTNYLRHALERALDDMERHLHGATMKHVNRGEFLGTKIPLPPLEEQLRIAAILDRVSFLLMRSDNACSLVDKLQESIFIHSFGEFGEAAARYPTLKLEDVCSLITDGEHQTPLRSDSGVKLLSARNIRNGKLDFSDVDFVPMEEFARIGRRCAPVRGDVLISCSGSIGRVAVVDTDEPLAMVRSAAMARPIQSKVRPFYLEILLRSKHLQQCMQKSANASSQANLFQGKIRALPVFLPSLEEQDAFVARASKARASAHILASRVIELQALMQSAQNAAFSGGIQQ